MPPHTQEAFKPPYTPRSMYAFLQPQISVCIPLRSSVCFWRALLPSYISKHCCLHTTQPKKVFIRPKKHCRLLTLLTTLAHFQVSRKMVPWALDLKTETIFHTNTTKPLLDYYYYYYYYYYCGDTFKKRESRLRKLFWIFPQKDWLHCLQGL